MHFRPVHLIALAGTLVVLASSSASAQQTSAPIGRSRVELGVAVQPDGALCLNAAPDDNIVWGTSLIDLSTGEACRSAAGADDDNIVWGTAIVSGDFDNIVWGTAIVDDDNIVWGTAIGGDDNIVWGTEIGGDDNIVWGTRSSLEF